MQTFVKIMRSPKFVKIMRSPILWLLVEISVSWYYRRANSYWDFYIRIKVSTTFIEKIHKFYENVRFMTQY